MEEEKGNRRKNMKPSNFSRHRTHDLGISLYIFLTNDVNSIFFVLGLQNMTTLISVNLHKICKYNFMFCKTEIKV